MRNRTGTVRVRDMLSPEGQGHRLGSFGRDMLCFPRELRGRAVSMQQKVSYTSLQREAIAAAAAKILSHPSFRSSERSARLFRYLLDRALSDEGGLLKERRIGHEVFGREVGYDTAADPVVRNAASETRKRLRQYEAESGADEQVHIQLAPGAYLLDFRFSEPGPLPDKPPEPDEPAIHSFVEPARLQNQTNISAPPLPRRSVRVAYGITLLAIICCIGLALALLRQRDIAKQAQQPSFGADPFWSPIFTSGKEVFICLGHPDPIRVNDSSLQLASGGLERITLTDLKAYTNFSGFLQLNGQAFQMRIDNQTTLLDLRDRPAVLIGDHNNAWARRLTSNLRYRFDYHEENGDRPDRFVTIFDSQQPNRAWQVPAHPSTVPYVDYAVAGRVLDSVTGGLIVYVAGAGPVATQAASEFLTRPQFLRGVPESLKTSRTNIQMVLKTLVVAGVPGSPEVVATYVW